MGNNEPYLLDPRNEAEAFIQKQIKIGEELKGRAINDKPALRQLLDDFNAWDDYNHDLLQELFSNKSEATKYDDGDRDEGVFRPGNSYKSLSHEIDCVRKDIDKKIRLLRSVEKRLDSFQR